MLHVSERGFDPALSEVNKSFATEGDLSCSKSQIDFPLFILIYSKVFFGV